MKDVVNILISGTSSGVIVVVPICKPPVAPKVCGPPFLSYMGHYDGVR